MKSDMVPALALHREAKEKTTGDGWFNMKAPELTPELKADLKVIKMRGSMDPKRFYKKERPRRRCPSTSRLEPTAGYSINQSDFIYIALFIQIKMQHKVLYMIKTNKIKQ